MGNGAWGAMWGVVDGVVGGRVRSNKTGTKNKRSSTAVPEPNDRKKTSHGNPKTKEGKNEVSDATHEADSKSAEQDSEIADEQADYPCIHQDFTNGLHVFRTNGYQLCHPQTSPNPLSTASSSTSH